MSEWIILALSNTVIVVGAFLWMRYSAWKQDLRADYSASQVHINNGFDVNLADSSTWIMAVRVGDQIGVTINDTEEDEGNYGAITRRRAMWFPADIGTIQAVVTAMGARKISK
jgi:hypothetical protein